MLGSDWKCNKVAKCRPIAFKYSPRQILIYVSAVCSKHFLAKAFRVWLNSKYEIPNPEQNPLTVCSWRLQSFGCPEPGEPATGLTFVIAKGGESGDRITSFRIFPAPSPHLHERGQSNNILYLDAWPKSLGSKSCMKRNSLRLFRLSA